MGAPTLDQVADPERLIECFEWLRERGGSAVGTDKVRFDDLGRRQMPFLMRSLSEVLQEQRYRPGPRRRLKIPKPSGGTRTLAIPDLIERVVTRSLLLVMTPFWEQRFHPWSIGFRPRRRTWDLLLAIEAAIDAGRHVIVNEDIRKAFDNIETKDIMTVHRRHLADARLARLIGAITRGGENSRRGIAQGSAYSPVAMNALLHYHLDEPFGETHAATPWRRYADNIVYFCQDVPEALEARRRVASLLTAIGMTLKGQPDSLVDLSQKTAHTDLMGYRLTTDQGKLQINVMPTSWDSLRLALEDCHDSEMPRARAAQVVRSWMDYQAPALGGTVDELCQQIINQTRSAGLQPLGIYDLHGMAEEAWKRWMAYRVQRTEPRDDRAAAPPAADFFFGRPEVADATIGDLRAPF